jgi:plastocyanin
MENSIKPGTSVTIDVQEGIGYIRFNLRLNTINVRTNQLIIVEKNKQEEFIIINSTVIVNESNNISATLASYAMFPIITINTQPAQSTSVKIGSISGILSVSADVTPGESISYQWYSNTTNSNTAGTKIIIGGSGANFVIPTTLSIGTYYYFCEVSGTGGAVSVRSNVATVIVSNLPIITINTHPAISTNVNVGKISEHLIVTATVTQGATLSYQWYSNFINNNTGGNVISNATSEIFTIPTTLTEGTYYYFCEVKATDGAVSVRSNVATVYSREYHLGDRGPAGGFIFYDKGVFSNGWRYLEAAPPETEFSAIWGSNSIHLPETTVTAIGTGKQNTVQILNSHNSSTWPNIAARICDNMTFNGFSNWFLPSKDELDLMYINLKAKGLGGFTNNNYWSSSQWSSSSSYSAYAWYQNFNNGSQTYGPNLKASTHSVRAIRSF